MIGIKSVVLAIAIVAVLGAARPAAASGGGCRDTSGSGFTIGSCISTNGGWLWPDFYVNNAPWDQSLYTCRMEVIDSWGDPVYTGDFDCDIGHHGPIRVGQRSGVKYWTLVTVFYGSPGSGFTELAAWSPVIQP
jgi:hypothetical protein